jgi:M6 family metalloprotease-like protein
MRRFGALFCALGLIAQVSLVQAHAANPAPGVACSKIGKIQIFSGKKYTCIKKGKKLIWNTGAKVPEKQGTKLPASDSAKSEPSNLAPTPAPSPSSIQTQAPIQKPEIKTTELSDYKSPSECKLQRAGTNHDVDLSHTPRNWILLDPTKPVRMLIFPVDFPDLVSPTKDSPDFSPLISSIENFYKSQSGGKLEFKWTVASEFSRMSKSIESYGVGTRASGSVWQLNYDIQDLAFQKYNKEDFDFIIGSAPTTTTRELIASSPAFGTRDAKYKGATYLGGDYWSGGRQWTIPAHEFGHFALGIADLYDFKSSMLGASGFEAQFQHMGVFDIMNWAGGAGLELTAWSRWVAKLISDSQILCQPQTRTLTMLEPIESVNSSVKGIVIPISSKSVLVIENRTAQGFDSRLPEGAQGVIVYSVDTSIESGQGPMRMVRKIGSSDNLFRDNALKKGESMTHLGYTIKVVEQFEGNAYIEIQRS